MANYVIVGGELSHYGIKGMKWGVRRFQNRDGSLKPAGKKRYVTTAQGMRNAKAAAKAAARDSIAKDKAYNKQLRAERKAAKTEDDATDNNRKGLSDKQKKALKVGAAVAGTALVAYGAYKVNKFVREKNYEVHLGRELAESEELLNAWRNRQALSVNDFGGDFDKYMRYMKEDYGPATSKGLKNVYDAAYANASKLADTDTFGEAVRNVTGGTRLEGAVAAAGRVGNAARTAGSAVGNAARTAGNAARNAADKAKFINQVNRDNREFRRNYNKAYREALKRRR